MLFYDWGRIYRKTGGSSKRILLAFKAHASSRMPLSVRDPLYNYLTTDFSGSSFMIKPHDLISNYFRYTPKEAAQYIGLASRRNYGEYTVSQNKTLDLFHSPVNQDIINQNRLLRIVDDKIHFYYEEDISRRNKIWH